MMPLTISRSVIVIILPGIVAISPWILWVAITFPAFFEHYKDYETLFNASFIGLAIIVGSVLEGLLSRVEIKWDEKKEKDLDVYNNWIQYLCFQCSNEPVALRYLSRKATTLYFELVMAFACLASFFGLAFIVYQYMHGWFKLLLILPILFGIACMNFFKSQAEETHLLLCKTRKRINEELKTK